jgi:hypothetical protein
MVQNWKALFNSTQQITSPHVHNGLTLVTWNIYFVRFVNVAGLMSVKVLKVLNREYIRMSFLTFDFFFTLKSIGVIYSLRCISIPRLMSVEQRVIKILSTQHIPTVYVQFDPWLLTSKSMGIISSLRCTSVPSLPTKGISRYWEDNIFLSPV